MKNYALEIYEDYLLGKKKILRLNIEAIADKPIKKEDKKIAKERLLEKASTEIIRYAIKDILRWDPQYAAENITGEIVDQLKIRTLFKHIDIPITVIQSGDYRMLMKKVFPSEVSYNLKDQAVDIYKKILNGEMKSFPNGYFKDELGREKLSAVLNYYIATNLAASSIKELYSDFAKGSGRIKKLDSAYIFYAYSGVYDSPLDLLHNSIGDKKDDFLYNFYSFMGVFDEISKEM